MINPTQLRTNLYQLLDEVITTDQPLEIIRNGVVLQIAVKKELQFNRLKTLKAHPNTIVGDPDEIIQLDWTENWQGHDL